MLTRSPGWICAAISRPSESLNTSTSSTPGHLPSETREIPCGSYTNFVSSRCFIPDNKQLASAGMDRAIRIWNAVTGAVLPVSIRVDAPIKALAYRPDGSELMVGRMDGVAHVFPRLELQQRMREELLRGGETR